jgi:hypothetical protein
LILLSEEMLSAIHCRKVMLLAYDNCGYPCHPCDGSLVNS